LTKRARILGWILIAAFPPAFLAAVEGCVRVFRISPAFERDAALPAWLDRNILVKDARWVELLSESPGDLRNYYSTYRWDRYLFYTLRPNLSIPLTDVLAPPGLRERTRWTLRTNSRGYPGREAAYGPHPGTFRIVCLGDSSTFGWGVGGEDAYPALLEREVALRHPGLRVEVVNLGICGYSSLQGRVLLEREALRYEPDVVSLSYGSNDWSRVPEPFDEVLRRNAGWLGGLRALLNRSRAYQIYAAFLTRKAALEGSPALDRLRPGTEAMPLNVGPEKSEANLAAMTRAVRAAGADPILVTNCVPGGMAEPIRSAAAGTATPLVDTESLLRSVIPEVAGGRFLAAEHARTLALYGEDLLAEHPELEVYLADFCHPNAVGHRVLAGALATAVEATPAFRRAAGG